jgi:hypothetical protein
VPLCSRRGQGRHFRIGCPYRMLSPKAGDMIARNPENHEDQWLVAAQYFADHFEAA